jgi:glycerol-3-phosphate dehydrogenase (NAD(P)+)
VVASCDFAAALSVQNLVASKNFRVYTNSDPIGVELGGTLKNVIAIAVGVCDGLKLGTNAKAALITRSLPEIMQVGKYFGAQPETFWGLSGLGDLLATCSSSLSRNYQVGYGLGQGRKLENILAELEGTAEGVNTANVLIKLADREGLNLPICGYVYRLLNNEITPIQAVEGLMDRDLKSEL